jgi:hypothetical protein
MSKSTTLTARDSHHFINVTPPVLSADTKIAKKQLALWRRQIRTAKEERWMEMAREVGVEVVRGISGETGNIGRGVADAHGQMFRGWLSNTDPITWAAGGVAMIVYVGFIINVVQKLGEKLGIKNLPDEIGINYLLKLPTTVTAVIADVIKTLPGEQPNGLYCVRITSLAGVESHKCYSSSTDRDTAHQILAKEALGLYTVSDYQQLGGTAQYCVKADGYLGVSINQCFLTVAERDTFIGEGLATNRLANPQIYDTVVPGSPTDYQSPHGH